MLSSCGDTCKHRLYLTKYKKKRESNKKLNHKPFHWLTIHSFNCRQHVLLKKHYVIVTEWGIWGMTDYFLAHTEGTPLVWEEHNPPCQTPRLVNKGFAYCAWLCFTVHELSTHGSLCCIVISSPACWMFYNCLAFPSKTETLCLSKIKQQQSTELSFWDYCNIWVLSCLLWSFVLMHI